ncbi:MAG: dual specificity protein phosphatase [Chloroflexota bacterium]
MTTSPDKPTQLIDAPWIQSLQGGRLLGVREEQQEKQRNLLLTYLAFQPTQPATLSYDNEQVEETIVGTFTLQKLHFFNIRWYKADEGLPKIATMAGNEPAIGTVMHWQAPDEKFPFCYILTEQEQFLFWAEAWAFVDVADLKERGVGPTEIVRRTWSSAPPMPTRTFYEQTAATQQFGGNSVAVRLNQQLVANRLFVGGLHFQGEKRPLIDTVLNLGEQPSRCQLLPTDRWAEKGEGTAGMTVEEIVTEAKWVLAELQAHKSVLVHCVAGFNRSVTICCAALILLEQISAEAALHRVWQHHPWARPDAHHWLALRWLAQQNK